MLAARARIGSQFALGAQLARVLAILGATCLISAPVAAQDLEGLQVEQFEPLPDQHTNILNVATASVLPHLMYSVGAFFHYVKAPLRAVPVGSAGGEVKALVDDQLKAEVFAAVGLFDWLDIGFSVPLVLMQTGDTAPSVGHDTAIDGFAISDIRIVPRLKLLPRHLAGGLGVGLEVPLYLPVGDKASFNGEDFRFEPRLIVDFKHESGFSVAANAGYMVRQGATLHNIVNDDVVRLALATTVPLGVDGLVALGSIFGSLQTTDSLSPTNLSQAADEFSASPVEGLLGVRYTLPWGLYAHAGGGAGLNDAIGAPTLRIFAAIGFLPLDDDLDDDGIKDKVDACPEQAEDPDGFEDEDGCPDPDNDDDGVADVDDDCPLEAEDIDNFEDANGCPDPDNDGDTILDGDDQCPIEAEDVDQFEDENGCPDPDNDGDTILDGDDQCPIEAEDIDQFEDENGCPDPDNDGDGFPDVTDACPLEAEIINGFEDEDGCPDKGETKVIIRHEKIEILDKVFFDTNKTTIQAVSYNILDQVAAVLKTNPQLTKVRVEGHTDDRGRRKHNLTLSQGRAESVVQYLVDKGIEPARFEAVGYGPDRPIDTNETKDGRGNNRRVEFVIIELSGKPMGDAQ